MSEVDNEAKRVSRRHHRHCPRAHLAVVVRGRPGSAGRAPLQSCLAAPRGGGCSSPWPVFTMPAAPRRGSTSPSSSAGHGGAQPRPGHRGARPPLSRRLGPRRGSGRGTAAPLRASAGLWRMPAWVLGGGAPQEYEPAARSRGRTRRHGRPSRRRGRGFRRSARLAAGVAASGAAPGEDVGAGAAGRRLGWRRRAAHIWVEERDA
ncbi:hypothetical protein PVAP13_4NG162611 [Panicum virgatum]|uniref:Uncharacterized protein n=1 Tax=Panicum virgatum TaxID=38727 RepID=A0A8T0T550_PANVG|nr:hypothetical protein PVAP13_4NG162611 [Panicum virgatum]